MLAATDFGQYGFWLPPQVSAHGHQIDNLINIVHYFMAVLFIGWGAFFAYCLFSYRQRAGRAARYEPVKAKISKYSEIGVGIFEAFLLLALSMPVWANYKNDPPAKDERLEIRAIGEQFQWDFHYPGKDGIFGRTRADLIDTASNPVGLDDTDPNAKDDIWTINELHLPTATNIYVRITSKDVIHSFAIPTMRVKQDAIPGMEIPVWFKVLPEATTENLKKSMTREYELKDWDRLRHMVATQEYKDRAGTVLLAVGQDLGPNYSEGEKKIAELREAGHAKVWMQPRNPLEVVCAQLCGNSHFNMKAQIVTHDKEGFEKWMADRKAAEDVQIDF